MNEPMEPRRHEVAKTDAKGFSSVYDFHARNVSKLDGELEELASRVIGAAIAGHRVLGPGLPEVGYQKALGIELGLIGIQYACEVVVPVYYREQLVAQGKIDMLVEGRLIVENKVVEGLNPVHRAQTISYLCTMNLELGLLINWNVAILKDGIKRVIRSH